MPLMCLQIEFPNVIKINGWFTGSLWTTRNDHFDAIIARLLYTRMKASRLRIATICRHKWVRFRLNETEFIFIETVRGNCVHFEGIVLCATTKYVYKIIILRYFMPVSPGRILLSNIMIRIVQQFPRACV